MTTLELKSSLHKVIDRIQDEELLQAIYDFLKTRENSKTGQLWESLTKDQKKELLASYEESENDNSLISNDDVFDP